MDSIKRALVSVSNKEGLIEFLMPLVAQGLEIVSIGGTLDYLQKNKFKVTDISVVTGFPEVLDGRVKTLHPFVHMGLLADKRNPQHVEQLKKHSVSAFDMVVGNLYPFEEAAQNEQSTEEQLIEKIDIGGPSFLRSSAKNYQSVVVVCDPDDYQWVQNKILSQQITDDDRKKLALKVFSLTSYYDALIVQKLSAKSEEQKFLNIPLKLKSTLRYGENGHQKANWYENPLEKNSLSSIKIHQGKELSYNNLLDLDAAFGLVQQFTEPACVAVKHNNPCGVAIGATLLEASQKAISSDPKSIFGGIVAFNKAVDLKVCEAFSEIFLECVIAPSFTEESLRFLSGKKNLRVLTFPQSSIEPQKFSYKSISGGALRQETDTFAEIEWNFLKNKPSTELLQSMKFGEKVAGYLKSNSIAIVYKGQTIGLGMGQVNRVDAVEQALHRMQNFSTQHKIDLNEVILVSDAFFPFPDSIDLIAQNGIQWIVQPGGSVKDAQVAEAAKKQNINMVLTQTRHFRH
jgi:phosphoribosylaminoimidazolecarboxamide formyltransferase / IMP cyclohydrolase